MANEKLGRLPKSIPTYFELCAADLAFTEPGLEQHGNC